MLRFAIVSMVLTASFAHAAEEPTFRVKCSKEKDSVAITSKDGTTTFTVTSPGGIGDATIERVGDAWPKSIVLKLNLRALEGFHAKAGTMSMHAFVNTESKKSVTFSKDGKEIPGYDAKHPLWTEIRIFDADGKPRDTTHLRNGGWFEITLPKDFFEGNPKSFTVNWVDYYRR